MMLMAVPFRGIFVRGGDVRDEFTLDSERGVDSENGR